ncbi:Phage terminase, large subunit GpA [Mameliella alba]|uniref:phage terminase large subunit family protein n=1 Tax=Mameliella alba TaxID=561184 RepID=UPI0008836687|nr:phage terminase large subunit family protein [Mameliella alba]OWV46156.1 terminase [Mameliella alba]PTR37000.1 phage terminase large subunit GpA-like protein [Mameliella alba]GGF77044.1 terminase [Mameliella alba]SDD81621.1 Phage terminase, large subunit GpA [Mameliella alba]
MEIETVRARALRALIPPPRLRLSDWIEGNVILPEGVSAQPGPVRLWPFQREIADTIGAPEVERVTLVKPVRVGFTTLLTSAAAAYVANDPAPILCLLPAEADCRDYMVSDVEPIFSASTAVADALGEDREEGERNTLLSRRFPGGSLKVVAARAPRNLRRHNVRVLFIDEADGMEATAEGSPILLAERRTLSFPDRKIVLGSTPVHQETSHVLRAYAQSDARIFEVPCPACGTFSEILWDAIIWDEGKPESARWCCPHCRAEIEERHKPAMVAGGAWRATQPHVQGHAGFRLNALVSLHTNASWARLAREFIGAKDDPTTLQTFVNTILGQGWRGEGDELDDEALAERAEDWGLEAVPPEVLALTAGCDVQHDRIEATFIGWAEDGTAFVLGHRIVWGAWDDEGTWSELDQLLKQSFPHALGGRITLDAAAIDAGDGTTMHAVTGFAMPRTRRKVLAIKGAPGNRPLIERAGSKTKTGARLWIVGVDTGKTLIFGRLTRGNTIRLSGDLPRVWHEQLASERVVMSYLRGQPVRRFERIPGRRAEALDCTVYGFAARQIINPDWERRRAELAQAKVQPRRTAPVLQSEWMKR